MVLLGALIAVVTGIAYNAAAALQKRETVQVDSSAVGLLMRFVRRKAWLAATTLSMLVWVGQVVALTLAPIALMVPLLAIGAAVLVVLGVRWLHERFRAAEIAGVALIAVGAPVAGAAESGVHPSRRPLGYAVQFIIAGVAVAGAAIVLRARSGVAYGAASGLGFAAIAIFSKEVGDRFADRGFAAIPRLFASPTPWLLAAIAIGALTLL